MTKSTLSLERFEQLLEAYGARLERWPAPEAGQGRRLLETSELARGLLAREAKLDGLLDQVQTAPLSAELRGRLYDIPALAPRRGSWPFGSLWLPALGWAAAAAIGLWIGAHSADEEEQTQDWNEETEIVAFSLGAFAELEP